MPRKTTKGTIEPTPATRGHWPQGKRRNAAVEAESRPLMRRIKSLLKNEHTGTAGKSLAPKDRISMRALAARIGVAERSLRRWLDGTDIPSADHIKHMTELLAAK